MNAPHPTPGPWLRGHNVSHAVTVSPAVGAGTNKVNGGFTIAEFFGPDAADNADLCAAAPDLLAALEASECPCWVHNAGITQDIEALRAIALWYSNWNNTIRLAAIDKATGGVY